MKNVDLTPLLSSLIGVDKMIQNLPVQKTVSFPPHNVELISENKYLVTIAVAGFSRDELSVEVDDKSLTVTGKKPVLQDDKPREFLHKGIGARDFVKRFSLGDYIEVTSSNLENGLLSIGLEKKVPEEKLPKVIHIT